MAGLSETSEAMRPARPSPPTGLLRRVLPQSLFGRALMILVTPMVILQLFATFMFYERHWSNVTSRLAVSLAGEVVMVVKMLRAFPDPEARERTILDARRSMGMDIRLHDGATLAEVAPPDLEPANEKLVRALADQLDVPFRVDMASMDRLIAVHVQLEPGVLSVVATRSRLESSSTYIFIMWMVGSAIVLLAIATIFMRNQLRPINRLADAADRFGKGHAVADFKPSGASEVRQAATAFLRMRERIERQIRQRTEMLAGVSHDLYTPLTRMKLQLALVPDDDARRSLSSDVAEMEDMVKGYLAFARGQEGEAAVETDLAELLATVAEEARTQGAMVEVTAEGDLRVPLRPNAFKRCLTNLIDNARRHGRHVAIAARREAELVEIAVDDDGPGIPREAREDVFKPFFRLDPSRNPDTGGSGLGLSIARDVARSHGGDILLDRSPAGGLRARVRLPL